MTQIARQSPDKRFSGLLAESLIEVNQQQSICAENFDGAQLLGQRINKRRHPVGSDDTVGVSIKSNDQCNRFVLARVADGLADNLLVTQMHAIKEADGHANFAARGFQFTRGVDDGHLTQRRWRET